MHKLQQIQQRGFPSSFIFENSKRCKLIPSVNSFLNLLYGTLSPCLTDEWLNDDELSSIDNLLLR